jgi:PIN domain nuclease of toxin-antitoxin system
VADLDAAVTDTHALIYHAAASPRLGKRAAAHFGACEERRAVVYVPAAVIWEMALLARSGHVSLRNTVRGFFDDLFSNPAYQPYDLSAAQIYDADGLRFNRDPFDALIAAAARDLDLPLLTRDSDIIASRAVGVLW